jgi:hypothetical protein
MTTLTYPNSKLVFLDENGNTGTTILPESITTPSISVSSITDSNGSTGASGYVLSCTGDGIQWITSGGTPLSGDLDMNNYSINNTDSINCTNLNVTSVTSETTFANQISFSTPPICSNGPTSANHLVRKDYVDNKQIPGIYNLYLNWSQTITIGLTGYTLLSTSMSNYTRPSPLSYIVGSNTTTTTAAGIFISDNINVTQIPPSLFNLNLYTNNTTANTSVVYFFNLKLFRNGTITLLGTSSTSSTISNNTTGYPLLYTMSLAMSTSTTTLITDKIIIDIFATNRTGTSATLNNYFENKWYSYLEIVSNNGSPFQLPNWVETATNNINMNGYNITAYRQLNITCPNKIVNLGNQASSVNIEGTGINSFINLGSTGAGRPGGTGGIFLGAPLSIMYTTNSTGIGSFNRYNNFLPTVFPSGVISVVTRSIIITPGVWYCCVLLGLNATTTGTISRNTITIYKDNARGTSNYVFSSSLTNAITIPVSSGGYVLTCSGVINTQISSTILIDHTIERTTTTAPALTSTVGAPYPIVFARIG